MLKSKISKPPLTVLPLPFNWFKGSNTKETKYVFSAYFVIKSLLYTSIRILKICEELIGYLLFTTLLVKLTFKIVSFIVNVFDDHVPKFELSVII